MKPISRRTALQLGGLGVAGTVIGGVGLTRGIGSRFDPVSGATLTEPPTLRSTSGRLQVRLEAAERRLTLAGAPATTFCYNGGLPGPTLHVQPGDRLMVRLANQLNAPTNLHVHGLHVSPRGNGDNPFVTVEPGQTFDYAYQLPADHPPGVFWYHPHQHGTVADQIFGGLYGAIIVGDLPSPADMSATGTRERVLVVSDISLDGSGRIRPVSTMARMMGREGDLVLVNGQLRPILTARPGERQRWRIVNACTARYLRLRLDGQRLQLLGMDSGRYVAPLSLQEVVLFPGNRADLLVTTAYGSSELEALTYERGGTTGMMGMSGNGSAGMAEGGGSPGSAPGSGNQDTALVLGRLDVAGAAVPSQSPLPTQRPARDLRDAPLAGRRHLTFAMGMAGGVMGGGMGADGMRLTIDGKKFDAERVDQAVKVGTVEEWTITNTSPMDHPLHLHVWPMQLIEQSGQSLDQPTWRDVVNVRARSNVKVRVAFDTFSGRTVYHCHILDHEDNGMMGVIDAS